MTNTDNRPVLVPVDFSEHSEAALLWACELAPLWKAPIVVLHVVHDPESAPGSYAQHNTGLLPRIEDAAADMLDDFLARIRQANPDISGLATVQTTTAVGLPPNRILEVADRVDARLIVMGSQGRSGLARFLLGSKAQRVAQLAPIPVTIVKAPGNADA